MKNAKSITKFATNGNVPLEEKRSTDKHFPFLLRRLFSMQCLHAEAHPPLPVSMLSLCTCLLFLREAKVSTNPSKIGKLVQTAKQSRSLLIGRLPPKPQRLREGVGDEIVHGAH